MILLYKFLEKEPQKCFKIKKKKSFAFSASETKMKEPLSKVQKNSTTTTTKHTHNKAWKMHNSFWNSLVSIPQEHCLTLKRFH